GFCCHPGRYIHIITIRKEHGFFTLLCIHYALAFFQLPMSRKLAILVSGEIIIKDDLITGNKIIVLINANPCNMTNVPIIVWCRLAIVLLRIIVLLGIVGFLFLFEKALNGALGFV